MTFGDKINVLMELFNLSGRGLAKAIHVDPSLISKWQNGRREPSSKARYIDNISDYLSRFNMLEFQKKRLATALRLQENELQDISPSSLKSILYEWLMTPDYVMDDRVSNNAHIPDNALQQMLFTIREIPTLLAQNSSFELSRQISVETGNTAKMEYFSGNEGKRQVMLHLFAAVLSFSEPQDIYLTDQEDITWLIEDYDYLQLWTRIFYKALAAGHNITMIHKLDRRISHVVTMINQWIPLYITGKLNSYYYPKYNDSSLVNTYCIIHGKIAAFSLPGKGENGESHMLLIKTPALIQAIENDYKRLLSLCKPLVNVFGKDNMENFIRYAREYYSKPGFIYSLFEVPSPVSIPTDLYSRLLDRAGFSGEEKNKRMQLHKYAIDCLKSHLMLYNCREYYSMETFDRLINRNGIFYPGFYFYSNQAVKVEPWEIQEHLKNMLDLLKKNDNYEIVLSRKIESVVGENNLFLNLKEDFSILVTSWNSEGIDTPVITTGEDTLLHAFENYFNNMWDLVPRNNRTKEWVIRKIDERMERLSKLTN